MMRKFLIDSDTASDDAIALVMAHCWPDICIEAITLVSGNVSLEQGMKNALYTTQLCGASTPIYLGCSKPMIRSNNHSHWFHGDDGMSNMHYPESTQKPNFDHAVDIIIDVLKKNPGEVTLVTLGPLTNIATALIKSPEIAFLVNRCVIMGGAANTIGNITPAAEYNIWVDPEAAKIVFHSGMPIEMVGWEISCGGATIFPTEIESIKKFGTKLAIFAIECNQISLEACILTEGSSGLTLADPVAMAVALDPTIITKMSKHFVDIEIVSDLTRGQTVVDKFGIWKKPPNVNVVWSIDNLRWKSILYNCLQGE
jgi:purine nucleosidase